MFGFLLDMAKEPIFIYMASIAMCIGMGIAFGFLLAAIKYGRL